MLGVILLRIAIITNCFKLLLKYVVPNVNYKHNQMCKLCNFARSDVNNDKINLKVNDAKYVIM